MLCAVPAALLLANSAGVLCALWLDSGRSSARATHLLIVNTTTGALTDVGQSVNKLDAIAFDYSTAPFVPTNIPTLGEWALVMLAVMLAAAAFVLQRRRR